ncbi:ExbD/TolR family protein [Geminisphaera colitermitum]|uniref:ExbD/TolR family protein n=1 Tax=Geminisphaera colitermitum TaxID=1148786 RepID=UPI0022B7FF2F|nr:biopolymer transporter ExbD [Geminisphaera colitermitum]
MARTFRTRRSMHAVAELNVTNLIDVAFTLLIIFMIATPLINNQEQTIPLNLPVESQSEQAKPDPDTKFVSVSVTMGTGGGGAGAVLHRRHSCIL